MDLILSVVIAAILFPIVIFIGTATRLSAARRNQRFAAMRLVGATPRQVAVISTVESTLATAIGVVAGFGVYALGRPWLARVPFTGTRFFAADLSLSTTDVVAVAVGVPLAAAIAARLALRRVVISPLGVTRRVTPAPPSAWRLVPVVAGLAELTLFVVIGRPSSINGQVYAYLVGVLTTMVGIVLAGPWLTMAGSRLLARRAQRPATLIAARRLADNPQAGFRAISGVVLALFVASVAIGIIATITEHQSFGSGHRATAQATLVDDLVDYQRQGLRTPVHTVPPATLAALHAVPGLRAVIAVRAAPNFGRPTFAGPGVVSQPDGVVSCAELSAVPTIARCAPGAEVGAIMTGVGGGWEANLGRSWAPSSMSPAELARRPIVELAVVTDGSLAGIEQARTVLASQLPQPDGFTPTTIGESRAQSADTQRSQGYERLAAIVILTSLPIAGCTLAVNVVAGLNDRRRPFSLLRLAGAQLGVLRRVVGIETVVPLLISAVVAIGVGFTTAYLFLRSQLSETMSAPNLTFYVAVLAGLIASLALVATTLPMLDRLTGPDAARND